MCLVSDKAPHRDFPQSPIEQPVSLGGPRNVRFNTTTSDKFTYIVPELKGRGKYEVFIGALIFELLT